MIVEWITDCVRYIREKGLNRISSTLQAEGAWVEHAAQLAEGSLFASGNSWFVGANIPGKQRVFLLYANTVSAYRKKCAEVAAKGYEGCVLQ